MLLKESWVFVSDNTNISWIKVFHLYKGFNRRFSKPGLFVKGAARVVEPPRVEYKGFKYKYSVKGDIVRGWVVRSVYTLFSKDFSMVSFSYNTNVIINKKQSIKSKFLNGPLPITLRIKKLQTLFPKLT